MEVNLRSGGWYCKLQDFVFGSAKRRQNLCPFFWMTVLGIVLFPFALIREAIKAVGFGTITAIVWATQSRKIEDFALGKPTFEEACLMAYALAHWNLSPEKAEAYAACLMQYAAIVIAEKTGNDAWLNESMSTDSDLCRRWLCEAYIFARDAARPPRGEISKGLGLMVLGVLCLAIALFAGYSTDGGYSVALIMAAICWGIVVLVVLWEDIWELVGPFTKAVYHKICPAITWDNDKGAA